MGNVGLNIFQNYRVCMADKFQKDFELFWLSVFMLFYELMIIRWLSSELRIFAYFHNLVLIFCFLGVGLGCALQGRKINFLWVFIPVLFFALVFRFDSSLGDFSLRNITSYLSSATDIIIWEKTYALPGAKIISAYTIGILLLFITICLVAACFIPFGQLLGQMFDVSDNPRRSYGINLAGSLVGILLFNLLSFFWLPPSTWIAVGGISTLYFLRKQKKNLLIASLALLISILGALEKEVPNSKTFWSPYQKLTVKPAIVKTRGKFIVYGIVIDVNGALYQHTANYSKDFVSQFPELFDPEKVPYDHYNIPFRFAENPKTVLIVGSGTGNDAAAAIRNNAGKIYAVEIDPLIVELGRSLHPEQPYDDKRVHVVTDDARSFFKRTEEKYDLIIFGLLDSHTLSSSYSNVRLDNYVYTTESFIDARKLLKPGGIITVIFVVWDEFIAERIQKMLKTAFGSEPYGFEVHSGFRGWGGTGFVSGDIEKIEARLRADPVLNNIVMKQKPLMEARGKADILEANDDWPYLYLPTPEIPSLYWIIYILLFLLTYFSTRTTFSGKQKMNWHFFFLGAGFLLIEVQNVSKLALLFGTTWIVNSIMISSILVMVIAANYYSMRKDIKHLNPYYLLLFITLAINYLFPFAAYSAMGDIMKGIIAGGIMSSPLFFAGIIFSTSFSLAEDRSNVFASNMLGAVFGGMLESLSFVLGIKMLLVVASALYLCSFYGMKGWKGTHKTAGV